MPLKVLQGDIKVTAASATWVGVAGGVGLDGEVRDEWAEWKEFPVDGEMISVGLKFKGDKDEGEFDWMEIAEFDGLLENLVDLLDGQGGQGHDV